MKKTFLLATSAVLASAPASADDIVLSATVDGGVPTIITSVDGNLNVNSQSFGADFDLNTLSINAGPGFLAAPGILNTNTLDVNQVVTGSHTLVLDILARNLVGTGALTSLLDEFSVTGLTTGWSVVEQTLVDGVIEATTPTIFANSASADVTTSALLSNPFSAEAIYTISSNGVGQFNGGIDISAAPVPGPLAGSGLPGIVAACLSLLGLSRIRRRRA
jgi:hypothetical protein